MTNGFDLLVAGDADPDRFAEALARATGRPIGDVDVADEDTMDRRWEAPVLVTFRPSAGDIQWVLDVTAPLGSHHADVALGLAEALGVPVLYDTGLLRPSSYWLAAPAGFRTRARVYDGPDDQGDAGAPLTIDAVERAVAELPRVPVQAQPEVIRDYPMATPIADQAAVDAGSVEAGSAVARELRLLHAWEARVVRMTSGWPPDGWYPAGFYSEDLEVRDELEGVLLSAVRQVDGEFRAATREAGPDEMAATFSESIGEGKGWWWRRLPEPVPWGPGREPGVE